MKNQKQPKKQNNGPGHNEADVSALQSKYLQLQSLEAFISQSSRQLEEIELRLFELQELSNNLKNLKNQKKGEKVLSPLGTNMFLKTELASNDELLVNVGSGIFVTKNAESAIEFNQSQITELKKISEDLAKEIQTKTQEKQQIQQEFIKAQMQK